RQGVGHARACRHAHRRRPRRGCAHHGDRRGARLCRRRGPRRLRRPLLREHQLALSREAGGERDRDRGRPAPRRRGRGLRGLGAALRKPELPPARIARLALGAPEPRAAAEAVRRAGFDPARQLDPSLLTEAGLLGTPEPLVLLARALETAAPGDFLVVAAYGEGADALVVRATDRLPAARPRPLADRLARGLALPSYERYLRARGVLPHEPMGEPVTAMIEWKELRQDVRLYGSRCEACGLVQYPQARICIGCQARDRMQEHKLGKRGTVFTFTLDNLAPVPEHPMPMAVIDLEGGGRLYLQVTDAAEGEVRVGAPVELTFRRLHEA